MKKIRRTLKLGGDKDVKAPFLSKHQQMLKIVNTVNKSNADFVNRLKDPNRMYIQDWASNNIATHKLGVGTDNNGNVYIYPEVQNIDGQLIDFTRPPYDVWAGQISAENRGDTVRISNIDEGLNFTENYKQYYPEGNTFIYNDGKRKPKRKLENNSKYND